MLTWKIQLSIYFKKCTKTLVSMAQIESMTTPNADRDVEQQESSISDGCAGAGRPRGAHSRSGGAAIRRYPLSKVRSTGCTLLEQP